MTPIVLGALLYFVAVTVIGIVATRRTRTASDFFLAGRTLGPLMLALSAMAATLSGFTFIGGPGLVYTIGLGAVFIVLPACLTNTMGAWVLAKRLRLLAEVRDVMTIPEAIGIRYQSHWVQVLAAVAIVIAVIGYLATNLLALGLVVDSMLNIGRAPAIWIGTVIVLLYTTSGGMLAGVYNDVFQGLLMAAASTAVFFFALESGGGLSEISRVIMSHEPELLSPWGKATPLAALSFFFVFGIGALGQPHVAHKYFMLRDPMKLRWYPLLMTVALGLSLLIFVAVGLAVKALVLRGELAPLTSADDATPTFLVRFTPPFVAAMAFAAVAAAIMSTVNSFMNIGAAALARDLPAVLGRPIANELLWGRVWTVVLAIVSAAVAQMSGVLVAFLGIFGWGLFASTLVPSLAIGFNWFGATRAGAIASIAVGLATTLTLESLAYFRVFVFPAGVTTTAIALVLSILVFFAVSWLTRKTASVPADVRSVMEV